MGSNSDSSHSQGQVLSVLLFRENGNTNLQWICYRTFSRWNIHIKLFYYKYFYFSLLLSEFQTFGLFFTVFQWEISFYIQKLVTASYFLIVLRNYWAIKCKIFLTEQFWVFSFFSSYDSLLKIAFGYFIVGYFRYMK